MRWRKGGGQADVPHNSTTYAETGSGSVVPSAGSKAGVLAMTRSLAVEWGRKGIRFNALAPGPVPTEGAFSRLMPAKMEEASKKRNPLGRFRTHEELANLAAFLVSDYSRYINGELVAMHGGECLQGAGEFNHLGQMLTEEQWQMMKPRKK